VLSTWPEVGKTAAGEKEERTSGDILRESLANQVPEAGKMAVFSTLFHEIRRLLGTFPALTPVQGIS
jgi:hypothetical protein